MRDAGYAMADIAEELDVSLARCDGWMKSRQQTRRRPWQQKLTESQSDALTNYFEQHPSASLVDGNSMLQERFGIQLSLNTVRKHRTTLCQVTGLKNILREMFEEEATSSPESIVEMLKTEHSMNVSIHTVLRYQEYMS